MPSTQPVSARPSPPILPSVRWKSNRALRASAIETMASRTAPGITTSAWSGVIVSRNRGRTAAAGIGGSVALNADGSFNYTAPGDANGVASFEYVVSDGLEEVTAISTITVEAVNDPPTIALASVPAWPAGEAGAKVQPGFASVSAFGPLDEAGRT